MQQFHTQNHNDRLELAGHKISPLYRPVIDNFLIMYQNIDFREGMWPTYKGPVNVHATANPYDVKAVSGSTSCALQNTVLSILNLKNLHDVCF